MTLLVFDLDDTLFPEREFVLSGFRAVDQWIQQSLGDSAFYPVAAELFEQGNRGNIFNLALQATGLEETPERVQKMIEVYRTHSPAISLFQDAEWALSHFAGRPLGIITDGYLSVQKRKTQALDLASRIGTIIYTDAYGRQNWKPSAMPYQKMMAATKTPGADCIYVGDNPKKDFITAKALGWKTIQICRENAEYAHLIVEEPAQAHIQIKSLYELETIV